MTSATSSSSAKGRLDQVVGRRDGVPRRSWRFDILSYAATRRTRSWRNPNWPRSGERGSVGSERPHLRTSESRGIELAPSSRPDTAAKAQHRKGPSEHRCVLEHASLLGRKAVEPCGDQRVEAGWHVEGLDRPRGRVAALVAPAAPIDEHPDGLDRVERDALRLVEDLLATLDRKAGHELPRGAVRASTREAAQEERCVVALRGAHVGRRSRSSGGQGDHEDRRSRDQSTRYSTKSSAIIGPVQVLEQQDRGRRVGEPLEEHAPAAEQVLRRPARASRPSSCASRGSTKRRSFDVW